MKEAEIVLPLNYFNFLLPLSLTLYPLLILWRIEVQLVSSSQEINSLLAVSCP